MDFRIFNVKESRPLTIEDIQKTFALVGNVAIDEMMIREQNRRYPLSFHACALPGPIGLIDRHIRRRIVGADSSLRTKRWFFQRGEDV